MRLRGHGLAVDLPDGWEGRIYRRPQGNPILHAANFALPPHDGDFGSGAAEAMSSDGILLVLAEYGGDLAGLGIFEDQGFPPPLRATDVSPRTVQRMLPGRSGIQRFFTEGGRPFSLYVVVGARPDVATLVAGANEVLATVRIEPPGGSP